MKLKTCRVLQISKTLNFGGTEKVVLELTKHLNSKVKKIVVCSGGGEYENNLKALNIKHYRLPDFDEKNIFTFLKLVFILGYILLKERINIVHSHHRYSTFILFWLNKLFRFKLIHTTHCIFLDKKRLSRFGSNIIAVGNHVKKNLVKDFRIKGKFITIISNGVSDAQKFTKEQNCYMKVGTFSRLTRYKGIDIFLKSIPKVLKNNSNVRFYIAGDGELKEELIELAKDLKVKNHVEFIEYQQDIYKFIQDMDICIQPSLCEGLPLTVLEVLANKKPIIASNIDGNNEIITDGINGLLFSCGNHHDLADKIMVLINNKELRDTLSENGYREFTQKYSITRMLQSYEKYYRALIDK